MSVFEFTATLFGIVIALAMARTLGGIADLIRYRQEIAHKPLFLIWFTLLLLGNIVWWFSLWQRSNSVSVSLAQFATTFVVPFFFFIATRLLVPDESEFKNIESRYSNIRVPFLIALAIPFIPGPIFTGIFVSDWTIAIYLVPAGLLLLGGTASADIRFQYFIATTVTVLYLAFAAQFRYRIGG